MISFIAAMDQNRLIGKDGKLPWYLPGDLKRFRALTILKPVLMGYKTFLSIGKPLPQRTNLIVSRSLQQAPEGTELFSTLETALQRAQTLGPEVMILGGASLFEALLPVCDRMYLTMIHTQFEGDTFFPAFSPSDFSLTSAESFPVNEKDLYPCTLEQWDRKKSSYEI